MGLSPDNGLATNAAAAQMSASDLRAIRFTLSKGFGRGYDPREVDNILKKCASTLEAAGVDLDAVRTELAAARLEIAALRVQVEKNGSAAADRAVSLLTTAQQTADAILHQANDELERVRDAADSHLEDARHVAAAVRLDSERKARLLIDEAAKRTATLEQQAITRLARLTDKADEMQHDIDRETFDLQSVKNAGRTQLIELIDEVLDQVAERYGRAHPLAARNAAARPVTGAAPPATNARTRRSMNLAGRHVTADPTGGTLPKQSTISRDHQS